MTDEPSTRDSRPHRSRRAVLGLTAGALAGVAGCIDLGSGAGDDEPSPADPTATPTPTDQHTPTGTGPGGSPTPVDPEDLTLTGTSVQSSVLGEHVMGGFLDLRTSEGWLVCVAIGAESGHRPDGTARTFQRAPGYPPRGALELRLEGGTETAHEESRRRNYALVGDAAAAWTVFELSAGVDPDSATVAWPAAEQTLGSLPSAALDRIAGEPPAFTLESFVAGEPGTTPGPTPHQSPTPGHDDFPTTTVEYELAVRNEGGAGSFRGVLDHETPREGFIADYSQGDVRVAAPFEAGERRTLTGEYTLYHRQEQATVQVRAATAGGEATSRVATDD
ncbi:hypothetical protein [Haloglomus litoreum]|uniref:hypothetical protein n=1 Tax=Haloglomus litoreum TaxID=3034026 RepID=UPI0023E81EEE|nr:hypothetical protein [Haloglomus sp. DT116]